MSRFFEELEELHVAAPAPVELRGRTWSMERSCYKVLLKDEIQRFGDLERSGCNVPEPSV